MSELPVTAVGKDFKPALRADASRRVVSETLPQAEVTISMEDGTPVAYVAVDETSVTRAREVLDAHPVQWKLRVTNDA